MKGTIAHSLSVSMTEVSSGEEIYGKRHTASEPDSWLMDGLRVEVS